MVTALSPTWQKRRSTWRENVRVLAFMFGPCGASLHSPEPSKFVKLSLREEIWTCDESKRRVLYILGTYISAWVAEPQASLIEFRGLLDHWGDFDMARASASPLRLTTSP